MPTNENEAANAIMLKTMRESGMDTRPMVLALELREQLQRQADEFIDCGSDGEMAELFVSLGGVGYRIEVSMAETMESGS